MLFFITVLVWHLKLARYNLLCMYKLKCKSEMTKTMYRQLMQF